MRHTKLSTLRTCHDPVMSCCGVRLHAHTASLTPTTHARIPFTCCAAGVGVLSSRGGRDEAKEKVVKAPRRQPLATDSVYNFCDQLSPRPDV